MSGFGKLGASADAITRTDELARGHTALHRLHPMAKLVTTLVFIVAVVSSPGTDAPALCVYFLYTALFAAVAEVPFSLLWRRVLPVLPFVLFAGLSNVLFLRRPFAVVFGIVLTEGTASCAVLVLKTILTVSSVVLLASTTPSNEIFAGFRRLGLPRVLVTVCMLCFRYITMLLQEAGGMARAYHLRAGKARGIELRHMGSFIGQLLLRSMDRAERVYAAMRCRGFDGEFRYGEPRRLDAEGIVYITLISAAFAAMRLWGLAPLYALI